MEETKNSINSPNLSHVETLKQEEVVLENKETKPADPLESASTMFGLYFPRYCIAVDKMSTKSMRRLLKALVGYPLEDMKLSLKNQDEMQVFYVGEELLKAKMVLAIDAMYTQYKEQIKQAEELKQTQEVTKDNNETASSES